MRKYCVIIPAVNEGKVVKNTLINILKFVPRQDIYLVDDGSIDSTAEIAKKYIDNVLSIPNKGKAAALNHGILQFNLVKKYEFISPTDADSKLDHKFFENILPVFDNNPKVICAIGKVVGTDHNWITSYRLWEYEMGQSIHKSAQSLINAVTVCPGPCTVFRSQIFSKLQYPKGTATEDMDLTFLIHRKNLGKITYVPTAIVTTQDPQNLKDYVKQVKRWYTGFWQCVAKHKVPQKKQRLDLEVSLLAIEGIFNGFFALSLFFFVPFLLFYKPTLLLAGLISDLGIFMLPTISYVAYKYKTPKIFLYLPLFYFVRIISSLIFLLSYGIVLIGNDLRLNASWTTNRYKQQSRRKLSLIS